MNAKLTQLRAQLRANAPLVIAYSGGVDSAYLLAEAQATLGSQVLGVIADSPSLPRQALADALALAAKMGASVEVVRRGGLASERVALPTGAPVRAGHTARVLQTGGRLIVYLYGGLVPAGTGVTASRTVDVFEWTAASSEFRRLSPDGGAGSFEPLVGHVQIPLGDDAGEAGRAVDLVAGGDAAFVFAFTLPGLSYPFSLNAEMAAPLLTPRVDAAGAPLGLESLAAASGALALVVGGRGASGDALAGGEIYAERARRSFRLPDGVRLAVPRSGAAATRIPGNRILVAGGRTATGAPTAAVEVFSY